MRTKPSAATAAGCLVTRRTDTGVEVLLVHARGASFRKPLFGIPKGLLEPGEEAAAAARRETLEETGLEVEIRADIGTVTQKSGKVVHAFLASVSDASLANLDALGRCRQHDAENDVCRFYPIEKARSLMIPAQADLLDRLPDRDRQPA